MRLQHNRKLRVAKFRQKKKRKIIFIFLILLILILGIVYFVFWSGFFTIQSIEVSETRFLNRSLLKAEIEELNQKNILLASKSDFQDIFIQHSEIEDFEITKNWKEKNLSFKIQERQPIGFFSQEGELPTKFYFDKKGIIFSSVEENDKRWNLDFIIKNSSDKSYQLGDVILSPTDFEQLVLLEEKLARELNFYFFEFKKDSLEAVLKPLQLEKSHLWRIIFNPADLKRSLAVLTNLIIGDFFVENNNLEYLDLRYLPNIYYKKMSGLSSNG